MTTKELSQIYFHQYSLLLQPVPPQYHLSYSDEVYSLVTEPFKKQLDSFLPVFQEWRKQEPENAIGIDLLDDLPFSLSDFTWRSRQHDLAIIENLLHGKPQLILETGSWNGWLANQLTRKGYHIVSIDYFLESPDGLKTKNQYNKPNWLSIQMDVEDIDLFKPQFDLVIFNRNLPYCPGIKETIHKAISLLNEKGKIILTGLNVVKDATDIESQFARAEAFFSQHNASLYLKDKFKKYLVREDMDDVKKLGFEIYPYANKLKIFAKNLFKPQSTQHFWALFEK